MDLIMNSKFYIDPNLKVTIEKIKQNKIEVER